jgi:HSP20 family protein
MPMIRYDPFTALEAVERDLNRMLDRVVKRDAAWAPAVDMKRIGEEIVATVDLPGVAEADIKIEVVEGVLSVSGERSEEKDETEGDWYHRERSFGAFSRRFTLPAGVDPGKITAQFADGELEIRMPAVARPEPRQIPIVAQPKAARPKPRKKILVH